MSKRSMVMLAALAVAAAVAWWLGDALSDAFVRMHGGTPPAH